MKKMRTIRLQIKLKRRFVIANTKGITNFMSIMTTCIRDLAILGFPSPRRWSGNL